MAIWLGLAQPDYPANPTPFAVPNWFGLAWENQFPRCVPSPWSDHQVSGNLTSRMRTRSRNRTQSWKTGAQLQDRVFHERHWLSDAHRSQWGWLFPVQDLVICIWRYRANKSNKRSLLRVVSALDEPSFGRSSFRVSLPLGVCFFLNRVTCYLVNDVYSTEEENRPFQDHCTKLYATVPRASLVKSSFGTCSCPLSNSHPSHFPSPALPCFLALLSIHSSPYARRWFKNLMPRGY